MALTPIQLNHQIEKAIRVHLTKMRAAVKGEQTLALYLLIEKQFPTETVTTGLFNRILGDMRRAGIIEEVFGKQDVWYLSDGAWELHQKGAGVQS